MASIGRSIFRLGNCYRAFVEAAAALIRIRSDMGGVFGWRVRITLTSPSWLPATGR